ncbi:beta-N-acetylglucosaminidase domain-containing protein [Streptomyces sp. Z423-1]|uniref:beta-N-acetylglucosaminidase domain-containing protein n=1 Tax=unclassified Streptomyces TaxID=2593676 RepID=UPI0019D0CE13|nr:beta-N-acetylglucosaminidase domain-containing protein [Streptomyces sp. Z423-1]
MRLRHGRGAVALAFAVVAGTGTAGALGSTPTAQAAPLAPPNPSAFLTAPPTPPASLTAPESPTADAPYPSVWPRPHSLRRTGTPATVTDEVALRTGPTADPYAVQALRTLLRQAGARRITTTGDPVPPGVLVVRAGTRTPDRDLPSGGYELTVDGDTVTLTGTGPDGLFHAVQTLRQLLRPDGTITGAAVRDWPGTAVRGTTEGFYGEPWTREQRLAQLDFMGRTKQNRYLYAPGADLYRQARWREPYPAGQRAEFRELAERARRNHVTLGWAVAPGQAMCLSSDADVKALTRKIEAMWALGFRAFQLQFQDVSYSEWHCEADAERFGSGPEAAARAHARVANAVARYLAHRHPDAAALTLMPTEYYQDGATEYRRELAGALDAGVQVAWTGVGVVPRTITGRELATAREVFRHPLVTVDNYPVNDYAEDRVFLGPYTGREPAIAAGSAALLANAMAQAEASRIPLFTAADFAWNPRSYRPQESWRAALADLAAGDERRAEALTALAGNDASSVLGGEESAYLRPLMEAFWRERTATDGTAVGRERAATDGTAAGQKQPTTDGTAAGQKQPTTDDTPAERKPKPAQDRLRAAFTVMRETPSRLSGTPLALEVTPWTQQLARYGDAGLAALDMLEAQRTGDPTAAWTAYRTLGELRERLGEARVTVGKGVLDPFLAQAQKAYESWAGLDAEPDADRGYGGDGRTVRFPHTRTLATVTVLAAPGTQGTVEARVPGEGWRRVGALDASGATELTARLRADAVRVTGPAPGRVRHLVPWFADSPAAALELPGTADAEIGGTRRLTARLSALRPADVRDRLTVDAPKGIEVRVPGDALTLPRGSSVEVPVEVIVPEGTPLRAYDIRLAFGEVSRTLTLRTFPRTAGPDLARTGSARSSADETPDFPASAANDGDPRTRWSSPVEDGAWWQVELARPVRLGRVVLHWQDAHPSAYRIQVSADGRRWRTAAVVRDGRGGREELRMDERDVTYVRVQGEKRATAYGYSLWSVETYAVAD